MKVLVLGSDTQSFLATVRSLGRRGGEVHIGWHDPRSPASRSRYIARRHDLPAFSLASDEWKSALIDLLARERFDLVLPVHDRELLILQTYRDDLDGRGSRLYLLDEEVFRTTYDKLRTARLAEAAGVPTPRQMRVGPATDAGHVIETVGLPAWIKPARSVELRAPDDRHLALKATSADEVAACLATLPDDDAVAQAHFPGEAITCDALVADGEILLLHQASLLHLSFGGGCGVYRRTDLPDPYLRDACERLTRALAYTGQINFDYRVDRGTGAWVLLEINPRFAAPLPLALAAGADFPYRLYQLLVAGDRQVPQEYRTDLRCRNLTGDLVWHLRNLRADRSDPALPTRPLGRAARDLLAMFSPRDRNDTLVLDDPVPGLVELARLGPELLGRIRKSREAR